MGPNNLGHFEEDSYVQVLAPNGDYRYGFILATNEEGQHLNICMHEEADSKVAFETATSSWNKQAPIGGSYRLSSQESRVLGLLSEELGTAAIAQLLHLTPSTIRAYLRTLRLKLHVETREQLVMVAQAVLKSAPARTEEE